jgi:membrane protease YdiL (CAAX protease family)
VENLEPVESSLENRNVQHVPAAPVSPSNPPWGSLEAVGVWLLSVLFILFIPAIFLLPYLTTLDPPITDSVQLVEFAKSDPTSVLLQVVGIIPAHLLTILIAWLCVTRMRKFSFRENLGWSSGGFRWWHYAIILGGFFVVASVVSLYIPEQENDLIRMLQSSRLAVYVIAVVATATAPLVEEVIYRGILYSAFQRTFGVSTAFLLVTLLFALVHVPQYLPSYSTILLLALLSVILTAIRVKTGNLLPCIILHTIFNGIQSVFILLGDQTIKAPLPEPVTTTVFRFLGLA